MKAPKSRLRVIVREVQLNESWTYELAPYLVTLSYSHATSWYAEYFQGGASNPCFTSEHELHPNLKLRPDQFAGADRVVRRVLRALERGWPIT